MKYEKEGDYDYPVLRPPFVVLVPLLAFLIEGRLSLFHENPLSIQVYTLQKLKTKWCLIVLRVSQN